MPCYQYKDMKYKALGKTKDFRAISAKEFVGRFKPECGLEVNVAEIVGVPNLTSDVVDSVSHLEVRYFLYDTKRKVAVSSV